MQEPNSTGETQLSERSLGWLRYLYRKAKTPDDWSRDGQPHPHWDDRTGPPMLSWHRFDLVDSSYALGLMAWTTPAWREVYVDILDELIERHTCWWSASDWLTQFGADPDRKNYPEVYRLLIPPDRWGDYDAPGWTANGIEPWDLNMAVGVTVGVGVGVGVPSAAPHQKPAHSSCVVLLETPMGDWPDVEPSLWLGDDDGFPLAPMTDQKGSAPGAATRTEPSATANTTVAMRTVDATNFEPLIAPSLGPGSLGQSSSSYTSAASPVLLNEEVVDTERLRLVVSGDHAHEVRWDVGADGSLRLAVQKDLDRGLSRKYELNDMPVVEIDWRSQIEAGTRCILPAVHLKVRGDVLLGYQEATVFRIVRRRQG